MKFLQLHQDGKPIAFAIDRIDVIRGTNQEGCVVYMAHATGQWFHCDEPSEIAIERLGRVLEMEASNG